MRYIARILILPLVVGSVCAERTIAQAPPAGQVSGSVVDTVGATIPRASVFVRPYANEDEQITRAAQTDLRGKFTVTLLPGAYDILVTSTGFESKLQILIVKPGKTTKMQWRLIVHKCDFPGMNCDTFQ